MNEIKTLIEEMYKQQNHPLPQREGDIFLDGESLLVAGEVLCDVMYALNMIEKGSVLDD